jgi:uncharacterized repeat protein (TIGR03803 family)
MRALFHRLIKGFAVGLLLGANAVLAAELLTLEAESGTAGTNFLTGNSSGTIYLSNTNNNTSTSVPGLPGRIVSYTVNFPAAGTYDLYARIRVGAGGANDDSLFYANGFGTKSPTTTADWILANNVWSVGFTNAADIVTGAGAIQTGVWKWINLSQFNGGAAPINFTVPAGNLMQTFQIGGREDGLDFDKFAFGTTGTSLAVSNLDSGTLPVTPVLTNVFDGPDGIALHRFGPLASGLNVDGANPAAGLALVNGVLVGTTRHGGAQGGGTAFHLRTDGTNFNLVRAFAVAPDVNHSQGELAVAGNGFFGTSLAGGNNNAGTVFAAQTNGAVTVLRHFSAVSADNGTNSGGASPGASLALAVGTLYGTTGAGGVNGNGTVFAQTTNGTTFSGLYNFSLLNSQTGTNADGAIPCGGLIVSGDRLYGTASAGGAGGSGVVFSLGTNGANFAVLHHFTAQDAGTGTNFDGAIPYGGLTFSDGTLYGTTFAGGTGGQGVIFSLQTNGLGFAVRHHFSATDSVSRTNTDGAAPSAGLTISSNVLYGTASAGGTGAAGTVFSFNLNNSQFTTIHSFAPLASSGTNSGGAFPVAPVLRLGDSLFGTTFGGGPGAAGTVFRLPLPAAPARITNILRHPDGTVTLDFLGAPGSTNVLQATASLAFPVSWQNVSTNVADANGLWQFTDGDSMATRFYRSYAR